MPRKDSRPPGRSLAAVWGDWLAAYDWDHFATLTFAPPRPPHLGGGVRLGPARPQPAWRAPSPDYAHREFGRFVRCLERQGGERVWWFRGDELGQPLGPVHLHALLGGTGGLPAPSLAHQWRAGFSLVERYDPALGAAHYLTKYVTTPLADYAVSGGWCRKPLQPRPPFSEGGV